MLWVIRNKVRQDTKPDEILEMAWSALWNITDETPQNCERFLDGAGDDEGLNLFIDCYNKFCIEPSDGGRSSGVIDLDTGKLREAVLRNMMGLLVSASHCGVTDLDSCSSGEKQCANLEQWPWWYTDDVESTLNNTVL